MTKKEKLERLLDGAVGKAIFEYDLIGPNDHVLVALSGGKDSWALLFTLARLKKKAPVHYDLTAIHVSVNSPAENVKQMSDYLDNHGFAYEILTTNIYNLTRQKIPEGKNPCPFCARMRRGALYGRGRKGDVTKIALGHHQEDAMETLLLNLFYAGQIRGMAPKFTAEDGINTIIRPMIFTRERTILNYAEVMEFPVFNNCPFKEKKESKRAEMKRLIRDLERQNRRVKKSIMNAMRNVDPVHLMDKRLYREEQ